MLINNEIDVSDFLKVSASGIKFATFTEIRDTLISRYKKIFGEDIDVSTASADGVYINDSALLINNILQTMKALYGNLDVDTASGAYLDNLCKFSNVIRKRATKSRASLNITNNGTSDFISTDKIIFVDKAGTTWRSESSNITIPQGETISIIVVCDEGGQVEAPAGWINKILNITEDNIYLSVNQPADAIIGQIQESDSQLRARRSQSTGLEGTTVLESLVGELLSLSSIKDVKVINNSESEAATAIDGTSIPAHSIYVILRFFESIESSDEKIANVIFQKLTPGIKTAEFKPEESDPSGESGSYDSSSFYSPEISSIVATGSNYIYWKKTLPIAPTITITIMPLEFFDAGDNAEAKQIGNFVVNYLNELRIGETPTVNDLIVQATYADPLFKGKATYRVVSATFAGSTNPLTYYEYTSVTVTQVAGSSNYLITIS